MKQLIDKSDLIAEIERRRKEAESNCGGYKSYNEHRCDGCTVEFYNEFLEIINTLETKDVDLEKEIKDYFDSQPIITRSKGVDYRLIPTDVDIAKHFYELGLKAQKGE